MGKRRKIRRLFRTLWRNRGRLFVLALGWPEVRTTMESNFKEALQDPVVGPWYATLREVMNSFRVR